MFYKAYLDAVILLRGLTPSHNSSVLGLSKIVSLDRDFTGNVGQEILMLRFLSKI